MSRWSQDWVNIANFSLPYPDAPKVDVTQAMIDQSYDVNKMFRTAEDFFWSLGLDNMTDDFWSSK